nr:MAG TPA: hypothetical protein [Caudoviricetes sp.]
MSCFQLQCNVFDYICTIKLAQNIGNAKIKGNKVNKIDYLI